MTTTPNTVVNTNTPAEEQKNQWVADASAPAQETPARETIGEKKFRQRAYWGWAGAGTFLFSVAIAYLVRDSSVKTPFSKEDGSKYSFKEGYEALSLKGAGWLQNKGWMKSSDNAARVFGKAMLTTATFLGGFVPLPFIHHMEKNKAKIVRRLNEKHGTAADVEQGERNVADEAPQSWGSIIKGRLVSWLIVFASFAGIGDMLIPKTFGGMTKDAENLSGKLAKTLHKLPEGSQEFFAVTGDSPAEKLASERSALSAMGANAKQEKIMTRYKRTGEISAVDVFATAMSATLLYITSRFFARKSEKKAVTSKDVFVPKLPAKEKAPVTASQPEKEVPVQHTGKVAKREESYAAEAGKKPTAETSIQAGV